MNIHSQSETLLMLAHDQLPPGEKLATQVHVTFCSHCRTRLNKMEGASRLLADTIRGTELHRWQIPWAGGAVAAARLATLGLAAFVVFFVLTFAITAKLVQIAIAPHAPVISTKHDDGCSPNLPSDKCR